MRMRSHVKYQHNCMSIKICSIMKHATLGLVCALKEELQVNLELYGIGHIYVKMASKDIKCM